eukprot:gene5695-7861_t
MSTFESHAEVQQLCKFTLDYAKSLDLNSSIPCMSEEFILPKTTAPIDSPTIYLCGNSLGLQPKQLKSMINLQLEKWGDEGVEGHFTGSTPWLDIDDTVSLSMANLVGAHQNEVVMMNSLTCNLHLMMVAFYRPTSARFKILIEKKAFPSDYHAVISQIQHHGFDPNVALIEVSPLPEEKTLSLSVIEEAIRSDGDSIALILLSGVQYYTGQLFDMEKICKIGKEMGCMVGFDLAHAVGNVPLYLHDWGCDFACWCTYKYLNCGPGSIGGCFVHEKHDNNLSMQNLSVEENRFIEPVNPIRFAGWWGHRKEDRFKMEPNFIPCEGAKGFRLSNPPVLLITSVRASLDIFEQAGGMEKLREKSIQLTGYLESLIRSELSSKIEIFTPSDPNQRGCQLSLSFIDLTEGIEEIVEKLKSKGVICDSRKPNVMRVAPTPLYNTFTDVYRFVAIMKDILS